MLSQTVMACVEMLSPDSTTYYTQSGVYTDMVLSGGCQNIITTNLTITPVDTSIIYNDPYLFSQASGAIYQWMNCDNGTIISGENGQFFIPNQVGSYALVITQNGCTDTSECYSIATAGINQLEENINVFSKPNQWRIAPQI